MCGASLCNKVLVTNVLIHLHIRLPLCQSLITEETYAECFYHAVYNIENTFYKQKVSYCIIQCIRHCIHHLCCSNSCLIVTLVLKVIKDKISSCFMSYRLSGISTPHSTNSCSTCACFLFPYTRALKMTAIQ